MCLNMFIGMAGCLLPSLLLGAVAAVRRLLSRGGSSSSTEAHEPLLSEDARGALDEADTPPEKRRLSGLRGLLVVGAPTVRAVLLARCVVTPSPLLPPPR